MMTHPTSDASKAFRKKTIKTKQNFQFKFNNVRRRNGSVGTVLSAEGNILTCFTENVKENWCNVSRDLKNIIKPCTVRLSRLSQAELANRGYILLSPRNQEANSLCVNVYKCRDTKMRSSRNVIKKPIKPSIRVPSEVDRTELHLELEKAASTFASEIEPNNCIQFENSESFIVSKKDNVSEPLSVTGSCSKKGQERPTATANLGMFVDGISCRKGLKNISTRNDKFGGDSSSAHVGNIAITDSEEEEWFGWNSKVIPLDTIPGAEIVSVKENGHVENIVNWNTKIETDSDMDLEEVFLLTDLQEIREKTVSTNSMPSTSDEEWHGWPESKPPPLCYIFKV